MDDPTTARVVSAAGTAARVRLRAGQGAEGGARFLARGTDRAWRLCPGYRVDRVRLRARPHPRPRLSSGNQNPEITRALLKRASCMESDHELAELLMGLVATGTVKGDAVLIYIDGDPQHRIRLREAACAYRNRAGDGRPAAAPGPVAPDRGDHRLGPQPERIPEAVPRGDDPAGDLIAPFFAAVATSNRTSTSRKCWSRRWAGAQVRRL